MDVFHLAALLLSCLAAPPNEAIKVSHLDGTVQFDHGGHRSGGQEKNPTATYLRSDSPNKKGAWLCHEEPGMISTTGRRN